MRSSRLLSTLLILLGVLAAWLTGALIARADPLPALPQGAGVDVAWRIGTPAEVQATGARWYFDYTLDDSLTVPGVPHIYLAEHYQTPAHLADFARAHPGATYILGNEPNDPDGVQDMCGSPAACSAIWRAQAAAIRSDDPRAVLIGPGLAECSVWWAQAIVAAGGDVWGAWSCHLYARTPDAAWVLQRVREFRAWQIEHGDHRPLIIGEVGIAPDIPERLALPVMWTITTNFPQMGVQAWAWFSLRADWRWPGSLFAPGGTLTPAGRMFRALNMRAGN